MDGQEALLIRGLLHSSALANPVEWHWRSRTLDEKEEITDMVKIRAVLQVSVFREETEITMDWSFNMSQISPKNHYEIEKRKRKTKEEMERRHAGLPLSFTKIPKMLS